MEVRMKLWKEKIQKCISRKEKSVSQHLVFSDSENFTNWFYVWGFKNLLPQCYFLPSTPAFLSYWPVTLLQGWSLGDSPQSRKKTINQISLSPQYILALEQMEELLNHKSICSGQMIGKHTKLTEWQTSHLRLLEHSTAFSISCACTF